MNNIKIKPLTQSQIIISIDRLTRFKHPETKYCRVFFDILTHNLIEPRLKKTEIELLSRQELKSIVERIINLSIKNLGIFIEDDFSINKKLLEYEQSVFQFGTETKELLENKISYKSCISLINDKSPQNLLWLRALSIGEDIRALRRQQSLKYPIEALILAEGATEEILIPEISKLYGFDLDKEGVYLYPAGGKNQVVKSYYEFSDILNIPILVLLDSDGEENAKEIEPKLRKTDEVYILKSGEFEDLLQLDFIKKIITNEFKNISLLDQNIFEHEYKKTKLLEEIFKTRGLHEFKKVEFAQMVKRYLTSPSELMPETLTIIEELKKIKYNKKDC